MLVLGCYSPRLLHLGRARKPISLSLRGSPLGEYIAASQGHGWTPSFLTSQRQWGQLDC
jgi:hypothetical protein